MNKGILILLSGYSKSGKDTAGNHLVSKHGFSRMAFADCLKDEVSELYNIDRHSLDTQEGKATLITEGKTARDLLIEHGQVRRAEDPCVWVNKLIPSIMSCQKVVVTDWRFPLEMRELCRTVPHYIHTVRLNRPNVAPCDKTDTLLDHFWFDCVINNNSSIADMCGALDSMLVGI